jgi:hypothetical protein
MKKFYFFVEGISSRQLKKGENTKPPPKIMFQCHLAEKPYSVDIVYLLEPLSIEH